MTTCSSHVLDAALGRPAVGVEARLLAGDGTVLAEAATDDDGRIDWSRALADRDRAPGLSPGGYRLVFAVGDWFDARERATLFDRVELSVRLEGAHAHVALLLSPFAYTTYRGS